MFEFIDGNTAVVRAAVDAGCTFFAGYPITPATSILLEATKEFPTAGGKVIQAEDEIASIGMCIAASMAGRKVLTATSGPGISLYSESIGLAIMGEVPMVIVNTQRMGPATGGATASADGDVQFARWVTSGGYPLVVLAPTDALSCYTLTRHAFNLAERYRTPVLVLSSKEIALTRQTLRLPARGAIANEERPKFSGEGAYFPYRISGPTEVPTFSPVGGEHLVRFTTSIHDERGVITSDRKKIHDKLFHLEHKLDALASESQFVATDLAAGARDLVLAYGVAGNAARDAVDVLRARKHPVNLCIVECVWPLPETAIRRAADGCDRVIVPEHNFGQYAREIERLLPGKTIAKIARVDGGLISPARIVEEVAS